LLSYSVAKMKEYGIVDSGDTLRDGIGAMSDARVASFFDKMVRAGVVRRDIDYRQAYTLRSSTRASASICGRRTDAEMAEPALSETDIDAAGLAVRSARRYQGL
jgi:hypothetical protein